MRTTIIFILILSSLSLTAQLPNISFKGDVLTIGIHGDLTSCEPPNTRYTPPAGSELDKVKKRIGARAIGTGFIYEYKNKKYIITCEHVVFRASEIKGYDADYKAYPLEIVGKDIFYDLTVLKFKNERDSRQFKSVQLDTRPVTPGTLVWSIGFWNINGTINRRVGEVDSINARIDSDEVVAGKIGFIKSTAQMLKGYSGGPLYDSVRATVVGMNTKRHNGYKLYYSLQSSIVKRVVDEIIDYGEVRRSYLGVRFAQPNDESEGVYIDAILDDSLADNIKKELLLKNVIKINNKSVKNIYDVLEIMENIRPYKKINLTLRTAKGSVNNIKLSSQLMNNKSLKQIAEYAIRENTGGECIDIIEREKQVILIKSNQDEMNIETVGFRLNEEDYLIYCLNDLVQFGTLTRLLAPYGRLEVDDDYEHYSPTKIQLSYRPNHRVLYY